ncbi:Gfo/Idh/MocA family oxidoreductase [Zafaria sp. Z1313]|uniref:Gfo/Idh/MocA family oxidoreductase n=1 Tax=unclassified Zafaria TaxID=2828765 RepID=UPI002E7958D2|nr:Gfo/Idh/MocA family oxidoreductase [Zafaria sp. J156]MEE1622241.1 Gfo/Idh/MocA family oxidoreductase [Zafaria sp. J156]
MTTTSPAAQTAGRSLNPASPVRLAVVGTGWIGAFHARTVAERLPGVVLSAVVDPVTASARRVAGPFGAGVFTDLEGLLAADAADGVVISSPSTTHADLVVQAAEAGKAVFVEKPMAHTLEDADRAIAAARGAGVPLQLGFNRRFAADFASAHERVAAGGIGTPQLLRSLTRDPELADPARVKPWTIFTETLIHDFDTLNWFNPGARPVEVFAMGDALVAPEHKDRGLIDTAVVTIRYDNGALAVAEASFQAVYGYDVRGEFFGSGGMVTAGDVRATNMRYYGAAGQEAGTTRLNIELFAQAYTDELAAFAQSVRTGVPTGPDGGDARAALAIALAAIRSVSTGRPVSLGADGTPA